MSDIPSGIYSLDSSPLYPTFLACSTYASNILEACAVVNSAPFSFLSFLDYDTALLLYHSNSITRDPKISCCVLATVSPD